MKYVTAIDIPLIVDNVTCVDVVTDIFSSGFSASVSLLDNSDLLEKLIDLNIDYDLWRLVEQVVVPVETSPKSRYLKSVPSLASLDSSESDQTKGILFALHLESYHHPTIYVASVPRVKMDCKEIETIVDHKSRFHFVLVRDRITFDGFIKSIQPRLNQLKHSHVAKMGPMGYVSSFSAYDKNNTSYAERLLIQAYDDYLGPDIEPKYIYTFDKKNQTFVQFRSDRNLEYHGMDISKDKLPTEFKFLIEKYHQ